ncbi:MAG TPA: hypothetical protein DCE44_15410 [Verrucomicrobiales bacterium]|nr:hypothetical protein [Verrucomicrobiales bacterium]
MKANQYSAGNKESFGSELSILEPEDTPFTSMVRKGKAHATYHQVVADTLRPARNTGTRAGKGRTGGANKAKNREVFGCRQHRVFEEWAVDDVQESITKAGGNYVTADEADLAFSKAMRELKRDMEAINLGDQEGQGGGDDDMKTRGFFTWVQSSAQASDPVPSNFRTPAASIITLGGGTLSETTTSGSYYSFNALAKSMKGVYGKKVNAEIFAGDDIVEMFDKFTRTSATGAERYRVNQGEETHEISLYVTVFESSFIRANIIPDQFVKINSSGIGTAAAAAIVVPEFWEMAFLEELTSKDVEDDGGGVSGWIRGKYALCCSNPKGQGAIV